MDSSKTAQPRRLTTDGRLKFAPVFAGSDEIVFATHEVPNLVALKRLKLKDGSQERLHPGLTAHQFDPAFSSDGRYHSFARSSTSPQLVLVIQDTKEKTEAVFRPREARAVVRSPSIAPDNRRVVFSLSDVDGHMIASVDMRGQELKPLATSPGMNTSPAISPDGKWIAFSSSRHGNYEIYVMNANGSGVRSLTQSTGLNTRPAWSPDGRRISFTSNRDGNYEIYVMNADGSGLCRVTNNSEKDDYATWHPDGTKLLMVSERHGMSDLYLVAISG
jgi:TolB protein